MESHKVVAITGIVNAVDKYALELNMPALFTGYTVLLSGVTLSSFRRFRAEGKKLPRMKLKKGICHGQIAYWIHTERV